MWTAWSLLEDWRSSV